MLYRCLEPYLESLIKLLINYQNNSNIKEGKIKTNVHFEDAFKVNEKDK